MKLSGDIGLREIGTLLKRAVIAEASYADREHFGAFLDGNGLDGRFFRANHHQMGVVVDPKGEIYVASAGTNDLGDVIADASILKVPGRLGGRAHVGFLTARDEEMGGRTIHDRVVEYVVKFANQLPQQEVLLVETGHSLGGAMASDGGARWLSAATSKDDELRITVEGSEKRLRIGVTTFGEPRGKDARGAQIYVDCGLAENKVRVVMAGDKGTDPVTRVPKIGFFHSGHVVEMLGGGEFAYDPDKPLKERGYLPAVEALESLAPFESAGAGILPAGLELGEVDVASRSIPRDVLIAVQNTLFQQQPELRRLQPTELQEYVAEVAGYYIDDEPLADMEAGDPLEATPAALEGFVDVAKRLPIVRKIIGRAEQHSLATYIDALDGVYQQLAEEQRVPTEERFSWQRVTRSPEELRSLRAALEKQNELDTALQQAVAQSRGGGRGGGF